MSEICTLCLIWHYGPEKESLLQINELSNIWMMIFSLWVLMLMLGDDVECVDKKMIYFYTFINRDFALLPEALHTEHGFLRRAEHGERFVVKLTLKDSAFISNLPIIH